jgi:protein-L-isoaspartate O-methyltransferase
MNTILIIIIILLMIFNLSILYFVPLTIGAPFEASTNERVQKIVRIAKIKKGDKAADLGSGDGRIVIAMAHAGAEAHGYEINPYLVLYSKYRIKKEGLEKKAFIHWKNFWKKDLSKYNIITTFQVDYIMPELEEKLKMELKKGSRVISEKWTFPEWKLSKQDELILRYNK